MDEGGESVPGAMMERADIPVRQRGQYAQPIVPSFCGCSRSITTRGPNLKNQSCVTRLRSNCAMFRFTTNGPVRIG